jgi:hypothetical protein
MGEALSPAGGKGLIAAPPTLVIEIWEEMRTHPESFRDFTSPATGEREPHLLHHH